MAVRTVESNWAMITVLSALIRSENTTIGFEHAACWPSAPCDTKVFRTCPVLLESPRCFAKPINP